MKNEPASSPRAATTVGTPRRARITPAGSSRRSAGTSRPNATSATRPASGETCCAAQLSADTPTAAPSAAITTPALRPRPFGSGSGGVSRRTAGTTSVTATTTNGIRPRNTQCQESSSVSRPATGGPIRAGSTQAEDISPNTAGCTRRGYTTEISTNTATVRQPAAAPCNTRPTSSCGIVTAVPATSRPAPNSSGELINAPRGPRTSHQRPPSTVPNTEAARKATNGQAYSVTAPRSATTAGIAVPTPIPSKATSVISSTIPVVTARWPRPNSCPFGGLRRGQVGQAVSSNRGCAPARRGMPWSCWSAGSGRAVDGALSGP